MCVYTRIGGGVGLRSYDAEAHPSCCSVRCICIILFWSVVRCRSDIDFPPLHSVRSRRRASAYCLARRYYKEQQIRSNTTLSLVWQSREPIPLLDALRPYFGFWLFRHCKRSTGEVAYGENSIRSTGCNGLSCCVGEASRKVLAIS